MAALTLLLAVACTQAPASAPRPSVPRASALASPPAVLGTPASPPSAAAPVAVNIAVGGALAAPAAQLIAGCQRTPAGYGAQFQITVERTPYVLSIEIVDYHGPATYSIPPERVSLRPAVAGGTPYLEPATSGSVEIDSRERSGSVDVTLQAPRSTRLHGTWACG